ncbi:MAG: hypothetical protein U1F64_13045 [Burkholderiales bacterium]
MSEAAGRAWRRMRPFVPSLLVEPVLPGATLFALLLWLSQLFVREGFGRVRQFALAPSAGPSVVAVAERNDGRRCPRAGLRIGACLSVTLHGLRRCRAVLSGEGTDRDSPLLRKPQACRSPTAA